MALQWAHDPSHEPGHPAPRRRQMATTKAKAKKATKRAVAKAIKSAPKNPGLDKALKAADKKATNTTADGRLHASTVDNPCQLVWDLADKMVPNGATRKEVMDAAQKKGVAFYTARTQYQLWSQASQNGKIATK